MSQEYEAKSPKPGIFPIPDEATIRVGDSHLSVDVFNDYANSIYQASLRSFLMDQEAGKCLILYDQARSQYMLLIKDNNQSLSQHFAPNLESIAKILTRELNRFPSFLSA